MGNQKLGLLCALFIFLSQHAFADENKYKATFEPYGFLKFDMNYDSSSMRNGDAALQVAPITPGARSTNQTTLTANQSRFGVNFNGDETESLLTTGKVEIDFYNPVNQADNKPAPMLRHAYLKLDFKTDQFSILAGQTFDVIAPLNPNSLNYALYWNAGNTGYRRPQLRFEKFIEPSNDSRITLTAALTRANSDSGLFGASAGDDSALPGVQSRIAYRQTLLNEKPAELGLSGSWSRPRVFSGVTAIGTPVNPTAYSTFVEWSLGLDLNLPITSSLALTGECYRGQDMRTLFGISSILEPSAPVTQENGGWIQLSVTPIERWRFNLGYTRAKLTNPADALASGTLRANSAIFANAIHQLSRSTEIGIEYSHWQSEYALLNDGIDDRIQFSFQFNFQN